MDIVSMTFYAVICGVLGVSAPSFSSAIQRLAFGAVVGVVAAAVLPFIKGMMGGY